MNTSTSKWCSVLQLVSWLMIQTVHLLTPYFRDILVEINKSKLWVSPGSVKKIALRMYAYLKFKLASTYSWLLLSLPIQKHRKSCCNSAWPFICTRSHFEKLWFKFSLSNGQCPVQQAILYMDRSLCLIAKVVIFLFFYFVILCVW